jgi:hypothetical protein
VNGSNTRITQDAFGTGSYVAFTGRSARGTAATPTQTQLGDTIAQFTGRGFSTGTLQFGNASTGRVDVVAAENFTDTSRATNVQIFTTASGAITPNVIATFSSGGGLNVAGNVTAGNVIANSAVFGAGTGGSVTGADLISATNIQGNTWIGLYTANVIESSSNLYYTNARVYAAMANSSIFTPYVTRFKGNAQSFNYPLPVTPISNNYVTVIIDGVTKLSNAYTLSGNTLVLSEYPTANADIDVRILDVKQVLAKDFNSRLFYGNSVSNTTVISNNFTESSILVFENGVAQVPGIDYTVSGGVLRFATAPDTGVTVEIRELPTLISTQTYVGGQNIVVQANGQINATVQEQIHPFLLSLL